MVKSVCGDVPRIVTYATGTVVHYNNLRPCDSERRPSFWPSPAQSCTCQCLAEVALNRRGNLRNHADPLTDDVFLCVDPERSTFRLQCSSGMQPQSGRHLSLQSGVSRTWCSSVSALLQLIMCNFGVRQNTSALKLAHFLCWMLAAELQMGSWQALQCINNL